MNERRNGSCLHGYFFWIVAHCIFNWIHIMQTQPFSFVSNGKPVRHECEGLRTGEWGPGGNFLIQRFFMDLELDSIICLESMGPPIHWWTPKCGTHDVRDSGIFMLNGSPAGKAFIGTGGIWGERFGEASQNGASGLYNVMRHFLTNGNINSEKSSIAGGKQKYSRVRRVCDSNENSTVLPICGLST